MASRAPTARRAHQHDKARVYEDVKVRGVVGRPDRVRPRPHARRGVCRPHIRVFQDAKGVHVVLRWRCKARRAAGLCHIKRSRRLLGALQRSVRSGLTIIFAWAGKDRLRCCGRLALSGGLWLCQSVARGVARLQAHAAAARLCAVHSLFQLI